MSVSSDAHAGIPVPVRFRVIGPDGGGLSVSEIRRLFRGQRVTAARRTRIEQSGRILALCGARVVGLAAYERCDRELRVSDVGFDPGAACTADGIVNGLFDALELACLASGACRLLLLPAARVPNDVLRGRGYCAIADGAAGTWFEKRFV